MIVIIPGSILESFDREESYENTPYMQFHQCWTIIHSLSPWLVQIRRYYTQTAAPVQKFIQSSVITSVLVVCVYSQKVDGQSLNLPIQGQSAGTGAQYSTCKENVISILLVQLSITMLSTSTISFSLPVHKTAILTVSENRIGTIRRGSTNHLKLISYPRYNRSSYIKGCDIT